MAKRTVQGLLVVVVILGVFGATRMRAQQDGTRFRINVDLVQLNVAVTDNKGNYVTGLKPTDFVISEDGITEKLATFEEGSGPSRRLVDLASGSERSAQSSPAEGGPSEASPESLASLVAGSNVFILFDTSNYMYRGFVFAQDAIADFVRSLETADKIAFYSYSRSHHRRRRRCRALQLAALDH
jgi:VWFA-related protein